MKAIQKHIDRIIQNREQAVLCTVVKTSGSTPAKPGAKMLVWENGQSVGTIGGGALEYRICNEAKQIMADGLPQIFAYQLVKDHAMCCGGSVEVFIDPIQLPFQLFIFGAGHIGSALAMMASQLEMNVTVVDSRKGVFSEWKHNDIELINKKPEDQFSQLGLRIDQRSFATIATHDHALDRKILAWAIHNPFSYLGMIGSKRKALVTQKIFLKKGLATETEFMKVDVPMGLDIGAQTPAEIAVSILAKLISIRNNYFKSPLKSEALDQVAIDACLTKV